MATRLISSGIGIVIGILVMVLSDTIVLNLAVSVVCVMMLHELFHAEGCSRHKTFVYMCYGLVAVIPILLYSKLTYLELIFPVCMIFVFLIFTVYIFKHKELNIDRLIFMIGCCGFVSFPMCCMISLKNLDAQLGTIYMVIALCSAWLADSGAYFVGTFCGKHKLCPEISPKKTVEGFIGGVLSNGILLCIFALVYSRFFAPMDLTVNYVSVFIMGVVTGIIGTIGDLTASLIKRQCNIKDFGKIMPGHGGVLDRFDSVLFVVPFVYLYLNYIGIFTR
ncbi:MAG: phosphatidate cytidylyltransferase [Ruminococcus sp.]|nr:phosphatidate cytidylyltransferase [Ruminococcus sp.]